MHSKNNRTNHDFQILHFLVGACHTPDGAYALLCDLRSDREDALNTHKATVLRNEAKRLAANRKIQSGDPILKLDGEADIAELEARSDTTEKCVAGAKAELAFINDLIERINPLRKFKDLSDPEAHEAAQAEEWKLELIYRAQNFLLTGGTIPSDHFATMRQHPEFKSAIWPAVQGMRNDLLAGNYEAVIEFNASAKKFDVIKMLEAPK